MDYYCQGANVMSEENFPWICPYCRRNTTINKSCNSVKEHFFNLGNKLGPLALQTHVIACPNPECREVSITANLLPASNRGYGDFIDDSKPAMQSFTLMPISNAMHFPDYIPSQIRKDYEEACIIIDQSPKASATLSRRCLQGMIRDFWDIQKQRLIDEINLLKDKIDNDTWQAIDSIRKIGNIGAHMEKDVNMIIDVDPSEAQVLISLIEMLMKEWYIAEYERKQKIATIISIANDKESKKKGTE